MATIIVVDDDESVALLVADVVEFCKHTPIVLTEPFSAVLHLQQPGVAAILTDYMMPKLSGLELLLIAQDSAPNIRRVLITAAPNEMEVREAGRTGVAQMIIAKPPGIADIRMALAWL
jgi:DNA-binding NtrC family response regulator